MTEKLDTIEQRVTQSCEDFVLPVSVMDPDQRPGTVNTFLHHKYYDDTVNRATPSDKIS